MTFWQELPQHVIGTLTDGVVLLKELHAVPKPDLPLGELDPFVRRVSASTQRERSLTMTDSG